jgi:hypothetical protein
MIMEQLSQETASSGDQGQRRIRFGCIDGIGRDDIPLACEVWMDDLMRSPWADRDTMKLAMHLMRYISDPNSVSVLVQEVESLCQLGREDVTKALVAMRNFGVATSYSVSRSEVRATLNLSMLQRLRVLELRRRMKELQALIETN